MTLLTAHKIFIASAIALFLFCALWELRQYTAGNGLPLALAAASFGIAVILAIYLRWVWVHKGRR